jgi:hypothetical protein
MLEIHLKNDHPVAFHEMEPKLLLLREILTEIFSITHIYNMWASTTHEYHNCGRQAG